MVDRVIDERPQEVNTSFSVSVLLLVWTAASVVMMMVLMCFLAVWFCSVRPGVDLEASDSSSFVSDGCRVPV